MATVLVIVAPGAEEIETIAVADVLVRGGHAVSMASTTALTTVLGSRGLPLTAHTRYDDVAQAFFDVVYLPGGKGSAETCRDDPRIQDLAERQLTSGRMLAVICAAPIALVPRRLCAGRRVTSSPGVRAEVEPNCAAWIDQRIVIDRNLITSQGAGTAIELGLMLVELLGSPDAANQVANAMLARR